MIALTHDNRRDTVTVYAVLAASAAAESCAHHATALALALGDRPPDPREWPHSSDSWRVLQAASIRFDDGSRYATTSPSQVTERAVTLQQIVTTLARGRSSGHAPADAATAMRYVANQLPAIARLVEASVSRWAESNCLLARARSLPRRRNASPT